MEKNSNDVPDGQLGDWLDRIPEEVQDAGEEYAKATETFNRAKTKRDQKKENLVELMLEHDVRRFPYRDGKKVFELDETQTVKIKKRTVDDSDGPTAFDKE